ncbi:MAG: aldehyde dehydrogenase family protein [Synergistaceae bacterium]|jgi:succinate-semialdehyde dehydrogenase|nr:aldehyde dehydrogenase family protein [Synergistaceae bacterium]
MEPLQSYLDDKIARAKKALAALESCTQEQVDAFAKACAKAVCDNGEKLARHAVDETKMGVYEDKVAKNKNKAKLIWWSLRNKPSVGIIERNPDAGIVKIAKPVGVVGAITPVTNPIVTPMSNAMFALKGRNPIIVAPHPKAVSCGIETVRYMNEALKKLGAPEDSIQIMDEPSLELTQMLMRAVDVIIATGGMGMVRAVYGSGKPALGVGAGNVQCLVDDDVDYAAAAKMIVTGRAFDNGIICTGEQSAIVPRRDFDRILELFGENGGYVVPDAQRAALRDAVFPGGKMNPAWVGQSAASIAKAAGISMPQGAKVLVVEAEGVDDVLGSEKMFPVLTAYRYDTWEQAIEIARANLDKIGKGHSISIHSHNRLHVEEAALKTEVSRIVVNQICSTSGGGSYQNGLTPTNTLGCGSWGNNSLSENLSYFHLINISRIANVLEDRTAPPEEKIWA